MTASRDRRSVTALRGKLFANAATVHVVETNQGWHAIQDEGGGIIALCSRLDHAEALAAAWNASVTEA